jgi:hypothetical protein
MKKSLKISIVVVLAIISMYSCSKDSNNESKPIDTDEYYSDSSGKYVMQLGDNGYNVFKDGSPVESAGISNRGTSTLVDINTDMMDYVLRHQHVHEDQV